MREDVARFALPSLNAQGHANVRSSRVIFTVLTGPALTVSFTLGSLTVEDARAMADALNTAADGAEANREEGRRRAEEAMSGRGQ